MNDTLFHRSSESDDRAIMTSLSEHFTLKEVPLEEHCSSLWDSVDQQFLRKGLSVIRTGDRWQLLDLTLWLPLGEGTTKRLSEDMPWFWQDFDEGEFKSTVRRELGLWSLNKLTRISWSRKEIHLCHGEERQIGKLSFLSVDGQSMACLQSLRGCEEEYSKAERILAAYGCSPSEEEWFSSLLAKGNASLFHEKPLNELIPTGDLSIRKAVSDIILNYLHTARFFEEGIIRDLDTECLHTYRVSLRKIRSLLSIIKEIYPPEDCHMLKHEFKELHQYTNPLRDLDVFLMEEENYTALLPEDFKPLLRPVFNHSARERNLELAKVKKKLQSPGYTKKMDELESYFEQENKIPHTVDSRKTTKKVAQYYIRRTYRKMVKEIRLIHSDSPDHLIHELRITGKKMRYLLEFFDPVLDYEYKNEVLKSLRKIQCNLGLFNDLSVQITNLGEKANNIQYRGELLPLGILIGILHDKYGEQRDVVIHSIRSFMTPGVKGYVKGLSEL